MVRNIYLFAGVSNSAQWITFATLVFIYLPHALVVPQVSNYIVNIEQELVNSFESNYIKLF